jgi:light-regulated signal transduction histidine kinase (bacteriophytochrome)
LIRENHLRIRSEKKLQEILGKLKRSNSDLEEFARIVSHDLQEPLRTITSFVQLLQRRYGDPLDEKASEYIKFAVEGTRRMQMLISDRLMYSRATRQTEEVQMVDCEEVLSDVILNLQATISENNAIITHDHLPSLVTMRGKLVEVLQNLMSNAIKYRKPDEPPVIHVSVEEGEEEWTFSVRDNGIGIDSSQFKRLFHLFQRISKDQHVTGTGIGLATCKKIIDGFGGKIWVDSELGVGSTFYFSIPFAREEIS